MDGPMPSYKNISIPTDLYEAVSKIIIEHPEWGFSSVADFIKAAVREYDYFKKAV